MTLHAAPIEIPAAPASPLDGVLARVRALCRRRVIWLDHLAGRAAETPGAKDPLRRALLDLDGPAAETAFLASHPEAHALWRTAQAEERRLFEGDDNRLRHLAEALHLTVPERDLVQLCLAGVLDPTLALVFGALRGAEGAAAPSEAVAARIFGHGRALMWGPASALGRWRVVEAEEDGGLRLDPFVQGYLRGASEIDPALLDCAQVMNEAPAPLAAWPVAEVSGRVAEAVARGIPARVQVMGPPQSGRRTFAACVALSLGLPLVVVDTGRIETPGWNLMRMHVQRQALLHAAAVAWAGDAAARGLEADPGAMYLEFAIIETVEDLAPAIGWHDERVTIPALTSDERRMLWLRFLPVARCWPEAGLTRLAERFRVTVGEIVHVAAQGETTLGAVERRTRSLAHGRLGELARLIDCPFHRDDLYLPAETARLLDEFLFEARDRTTFWEQPEARRLFPRGVGLIGLLSGPPGTGKTMAAQVVAAELRLDLFRIDLATTVDKYIGETAKRLRRLFARASEMSAVLLFDEADSLFSRRTDTRDSHDKYANADTTYLLQLVEDYPGVALLATNKRQQIDDAFIRRIRYVFYLPRPEAAERLAIWQQVVGEIASPDRALALDETLARLAREAPMTGAQIKNAVLGGVFLARRDGRPLGAEHLTRAIERQILNQGGSVTAETGRGRR
jgi:hypothetical protein